MTVASIFEAFSKRRIAALASFYYLLVNCILAAGPAATAAPPNVVLVMADDQGWGDMGYNGHPVVKTPHLDAFARSGIRFDRFYAAAPVCSPTRGSVLTGRTPNRFGCFSWGYPLRPQEITLAEVLKTAGYRTGHFGKWHLGSVEKGSPVNPGASGFDVWTSSPNFFDLDPILSDQGKAVPFKGDSSDVTVDLALQFIRGCAGRQERFLAVIWFGSPHAPHRALDGDRAAYSDQPAAQRDFFGEITAMDRAFGRLRAELHKLDLHQNTLLWYCSDNGALPQIGSAGDRRGRKAEIYEGGLLVPAILEWPAQFPKPAVIAAPCVTSDIFPTVLALTGAKLERKPLLDGVSLAPLLFGKTLERSKPIGFWNYPAAGIRVPSKLWMDELYAAQLKGFEPADPSRLFIDAGKIAQQLPHDRFPGHAAWLEGFWKLHRIEDRTSARVRWELYDLSADPRESRNLIDERRDQFEALKPALESWLRTVVCSFNGSEETAEAESRDAQLRRLLVGTWQDEYQGKRTMTVRPDGTGIMVVELSGLKAKLYAERLEFDMTWSIANGRLQKETTTGRPANRVKLILATVGGKVDEPILELTQDRLLLLDADGETKYDWRRVKTPSSSNLPN